MLNKWFNHPIWAMAFRPFYLLAALYGMISILLWGFGYTGTSALPVQYWHAHEMIWGYTGAIVVAFLLTAVATWTGQPPIRGKFLMVLVALWLVARISVFFSATVGLSYITGTLFYWLAALGMGISVFKFTQLYCGFCVGNVWTHTRHFPCVSHAISPNGITKRFIGWIGDGIGFYWLDW